MMKNKKRIILGIIIMVVVLLCAISQILQKNGFVELSVDESTGIVTMSIDDDNTKQPIVFSGSNGSLWFNADGEKVFVNGKPQEVVSSQDKFNATWKIDSREISVLIARDKQSGDYDVKFSAKPGDNISGWGFALNASPDEYFTGLYERVVDGPQGDSWKEGITEAMNLRGQSVNMLITPTVSLYTPFYLSSNGYGLFIDGTWPGRYDFCKSDSSRVIVEFEGEAEMSAKIYTSKHPAEIIKRHSLAVGPTIVPPDWAFLPWRWRDVHENLPEFYDGTKANVPYNSSLVEDVLMMKAFDIPCGVYWVDRPWGNDPHGYADMEWDEQRFPNPTDMISWIHDNDMRFLLWVAPWVSGGMMTEAKNRGFDLEIKGPHDALDSSNVALIDFSNPEACEWLQRGALERLLKQGVDGFKLDRSEELVPETNDIKLFNGCTARQMRNHYPVMYVKAFNEACKRVRNDDFVLIPRAGYAGSSKYSGFWGGDIGSEPEGLRAAIIALQRCAIIGFPIWGSDIGGYWHAPIDREVTARWLAFGCFNPIMEFGPTEDRAPWSMKQQPNYDTELIAIWRLYAKLHASLVEYTYALAEEANKTGMPIVRPLFLQYPDQQEAWDNWDTFLYGPDILVSAIWEKGKTERKCYLPEGETWIDAWDNSKTYKGGQVITVNTPIERIPIFIRQGSEVDMGDLSALYSESLAIASNVPDLNELQKSVAVNPNK